MTDPIARRTLLQVAALSPVLAASVGGGASAAPSSDAVVVIAELISKPDKADALRDIIVSFVESARHEPGCLHYTLTEDLKRPGHFFTYEIWTDEAAIAAHMQTPRMKAAAPKLGDILGGPFSQTLLKTLSTS